MLAGLLAMVMRLQLAFPGLQILGPDLYNQFFTTHGTAMMFLFAVPMVEGTMIYLIPLMVGSRIIAFPRLNLFSWYVYLIGGILIWVAFALDSAPDAGWFSYPPLAGPEYGAGKRSDIYAQMITFTEVSALAVAVEVIVTILKFRAPGMTLSRMPIFCWASLVACLSIVFSMPAVVMSSSLLLLDRLIGTHFYNPAEGGDILLWQHLFWYFGHPEVYIIFLPSIGLASHVVEAFSRRPMFGYPAIVLSVVGNGLLSFGLWVHHMFATGLPRLGNSVFAASSMAIAIPSGIILFCWIATMASGGLRLRLPMLWIVSFFVLFLLGGLSGVMLASVPLNLQFTDSYVVVGHVHYVLVGGSLAPLMAALFFWFPKITGRMLDERLGLAQWILFTLGGFVTFGGMVLLGLSGMTRRIYTYPLDIGWDALNLATSVGAWMLGLSFVVLLANLAVSLARAPFAPPNPWEAAGLEWAAPSPPPVYNYALIPCVRNRSPLWPAETELAAVTGLRADEREVLVTSVTMAEPVMREPVSDPSVWPPIAALVTCAVLIGSIYTPDAITWGALPLAAALTAWLYPKRRMAPPPEAAPAQRSTP
ncbi:MAG: cytochrome c oxidase subunit 1, partial [Rubritepida sp.]|nr:cytochrome c oxidase subunit 1 [Rubritepida sp.]